MELSRHLQSPTEMVATYMQVFMGTLHRYLMIRVASAETSGWVLCPMGIETRGYPVTRALRPKLPTA